VPHGPRWGLRSPSPPHSEEIAATARDSPRARQTDGRTEFSRRWRLLAEGRRRNNTRSGGGRSSSFASSRRTACMSVGESPATDDEKTLKGVLSSPDARRARAAPAPVPGSCPASPAHPPTTKFAPAPGPKGCRQRRGAVELGEGWKQ